MMQLFPAQPGLLNYLRLSLTGHGDTVDVDASVLSRQLASIMGRHVALWLARNREGGLFRSLKPLERLRARYDELGSW